MAMTRRNFLEAGVGGVALSLAQGASHAQSPATAGNPTAQRQDTVADLRTVVVGVDGADLTVPYLHDYLSVGATVWQYSQNTGVDPVRWTVCRLGRFRLVEHLRLIGDRR